MLPLPSVGQPVVVRVPILRLGVDVEFESVGKAVPIGIGGGSCLPYTELKGGVRRKQQQGAEHQRRATFA